MITRVRQRKELQTIQSNQVHLICPARGHHALPNLTFSGIGGDFSKKANPKCQDECQDMPTTNGISKYIQKYGSQEKDLAAAADLYPYIQKGFAGV